MSEERVTDPQVVTCSYSEEESWCEVGSVCRHELQHFVDVMQGYITNQLFYLSWLEFEDQLTNQIHSLDDLITAHRSFIDKAIFR